MKFILGLDSFRKVYIFLVRLEDVLRHEVNAGSSLRELFALQYLCIFDSVSQLPIM